MPRVKRPISKRSRGEASSSMEPPPQEHPMVQWFQSKSDFDHYSTDFAPRKVISPSGDKIDLSDSSAEHPRKYSRQDACTMFNIPFDIPRPTVGCLTIEHRLLHYFIVYNLVPRVYNLGLIMEEDLELM
ncbi:hypothetical protein PIB30_060090 [Stylosanthes scabra]|uniref:Uncharacterized protein n=1 Tax=Stylosanthes scabra TaxID=79078 RepID=A0ABU6YL51_9FABA|nr:hypothetical protein [Stylosanthes scabra]